MPDDLKKRKPHDASKISLTEQWEVDYWCKELGISETTLKKAVKEVGHLAAEVRKHLRK